MLCLLPTGDRADHVPQPNSSKRTNTAAPAHPVISHLRKSYGPGSLGRGRDRLDAHAMDLVCSSMVSRGVLNSNMTLPGGAPPRLEILPITHHRRRTARSQCAARLVFQSRPIVIRNTSISLVLPSSVLLSLRNKCRMLPSTW